MLLGWELSTLNNCLRHVLFWLICRESCITRSCVIKRQWWHEMTGRSQPWIRKLFTSLFLQYRGPRKYVTFKCLASNMMNEETVCCASQTADIDPSQKPWFDLSLPVSPEHWGPVTRRIYECCSCVCVCESCPLKRQSNRSISGWISFLVFWAHSVNHYSTSSNKKKIILFLCRCLFQMPLYNTQ